MIYVYYYEDDERGYRGFNLRIAPFSAGQHEPWMNNESRKSNVLVLLRGESRDVCDKRYSEDCGRYTV